MKRTAFIVPHTHWDREWYRPFESFRLRLVEVVDGLLMIMQTDPAYERFTLDGQSIVLEDYLAMRPEQEAALRELVAQRRVAVGPWYVLPDEFLVSGEALIRNLFIGRRKAARFGPSMTVGYLPDSFGHIAQMPQILRGFGIDSAVLSRGVGDEGETLGSEFWWEALDGSRVLTVHQVRGYCHCGALGYPFPTGDFSHLDPDPDLAVAHVRRELEILTPYARAGVFFLSCGCDHQPAMPQLSRLVGHLRRALPEVEFRWGAPREVVDEILSRGPELGMWKGELRGSRYAPLIPGVLSTRVYLKQTNDAVQTLLERWAEPVAAIAWALGDPYPKAFLDHVWELLLQNHPHDSICGCSVDTVHREMLTRFERAQALADDLAARSLRAIAARVNTAALPPGLPIMVFNLLHWTRTEPVRFTVSLPSAMVSGLRALDPAGQAIPCQILGHARQMLALERLDALEVAPRLRSLSYELEPVWGLGLAAFSLHRGTLVVEAADPSVCPPGILDRVAVALRRRRGTITLKVVRTTVQVAMLAPDVPPGGYKTFILAGGRLRRGTRRVSTRISLRGRRIENEHIAVEVNANGTVALRDRATGRVYRGHVFEDTADAGDEYDYSPVEEKAILTSRMKGRVETVYTGPLLGTVRVRLPVQLPARLRNDRRRREDGRVACPVTVDVIVAAGARYVEFATTVENHARDHRLRVLFPTGMAVPRSAADVQFGVVERPVAQPEGRGWTQPPQPTAPHESWVDVSDGRAGLAVVSAGLPEHEVLPASGGVTLALTLLRCVGWLSRDDLRTRRGHAGPGYETPEAQCQGLHRFRYALLPHAGEWQDADVVRASLAFRVPLKAIPLGRQQGTLPTERSFFGVAGTVITGVKRSEAADALLLRMYNPTPEPQTVVIRSSIPHRAVREVNLAEQDIGELNSTDGRVEFAMQPFQIRTVALIVNDEQREKVVGLTGRLPWDHQRDAGREAVQEVS